MRTGPVALAALGDRDAVAALAADVARLTHPHPDSVDACVLWSLAIEHAITTAGPGRAFDWRAAVCRGLDHIEPDRHAEWTARIDAACGATPLQFRGINGWVVGAFQAALAAITSTADGAHVLPCDHLTAALRAAARAGGDTDTVAAIAGSLLGARWGATAIPLRWRRLLHGRRTYAEPPLRAVDLDRLARLALRGGRPDGSGWPGISHMDYGRMVPRCVELDGAWFGNADGVGDAVARGATVVVSLCRMGDADVPEGVEHHTIGLVDTDVGDNPNIAHVLADTARTVAELTDAGERVFVHCARAEHRAPTLAAAYLVVRGADVDDRRASGTRGARRRAAAVHARRPRRRRSGSAGSGDEPPRRRRAPLGPRLDGIDLRRRVARVPLREADGLLALVERQPGAVLPAVRALLCVDTNAFTTMFFSPYYDRDTGPPGEPSAACRTRYRHHIGVRRPHRLRAGRPARRLAGADARHGATRPGRA